MDVFNTDDHLGIIGDHRLADIAFLSGIGSVALKWKPKGE
jgi:hypothetical protein